MSSGQRQQLSRHIKGAVAELLAASALPGVQVSRIDDRYRARPSDVDLALADKCFVPASIIPIIRVSCVCGRNWWRTSRFDVAETPPSQTSLAQTRT